MEVAIIITTPDFAGLNIKENLLEYYEFKELEEQYEGSSVYESKKMPFIKVYTTDDKCVYAENVGKNIKADLFLFPTTHRSAAGTHSLSLHTQGNWGKADLGGQERNLSHCPALLMKKIFQMLHDKGKDMDEEITLEVTHHGPVLEEPTLFLEIGSDETQWKRKDLGKLWADIVMEVLSGTLDAYPTAIGIGGPHYCQNFNRIQLECDVAIGHVCPKYALADLDEEMIVQAMEKTVPAAEMAILDWKGMGQEKQRIVDLLEKLGIEVKKTKDFH